MSHQSNADLSDGEAGASPRQFMPTRWSLVIEARSDDPARSEVALSELCQRYWYPLYGFIRRLGKSPEEAKDLTQGFFLEILQRGTFSRADAEKGKLRSFLLKALRNYVSNEGQRERAIKRGGNATMISLDLEWAEGMIGDELADPSADMNRQFVRRWAMTVVNSVTAQLESEYRDRGREDLFRHLMPFIVRTSSQNYDDLAPELGMSAGTIRVTVHRMRARFRDLFRREIADTLAEGEDVDEEVRDIMAALS